MDSRSPTAQHQYSDGATPLLAALDWDSINAEVKRQQRSRERDTPAISMFRWWARRSHALIGELLEKTAESQLDPVISDPFSGGGTVAIEAARRDLSVYAQDLHPWAIAGLRGALAPTDAEQLERVADRLLEKLDGLRADLYGTTCPEHGEGGEVLTSFWVRVRDCPSCEHALHLFPYSLVTLDSRRAKETRGWWGCQGCGHITRAPYPASRLRCDHCSADLTPASEPLLPSRQATCPQADCGHSFPALTDAKPRWQCVLVQRQCTHEDGHKIAHFDRPHAAEIAQAEGRADLEIPAALRERIPNGLETRVLRRAGLERWEQLYTSRQVEVLVAASEAIDGLRLSAGLRDRLRLALCGCAEMAGRVSRWDRYYPKAFEATANHRFALTGLSCETNLLADRGRGTLPRRLRHSIDAAEWSAKSLPQGRTVRRRAAANSNRQQPAGILLAQGSSTRQLPSDRTVDLVLTDPPYFDDVQYAELAAMFLAWARTCGLIADSAELDLRQEAVANASRGTGVVEYEQLLASILAETRRTLKPSGRIILTFHNTDLQAWWALGSALKKAGLHISALAVVHAENERDHAKRGRLGFSRDLVIECRVVAENRPPETVWHEQDEPEARELLIAGRAMAEMSPEEEVAAFRARFRQMRGELRPARINPSARDRECAGEGVADE